MTNWKEYKLGDIAELRSEKFTPNEITSYPYIGLEHIEPKSLRLNGIGTSNDVSSQKSVFYPNDTLYGKLRPYFQKVYSPCFKGVCSTDIFVVKPKKGIHSKFLFYILACDEFTNLANSGSTGTRMPRADWKHLSTTIWNLPDLPTQTAIAEILSSLDDKIELNNKINRELEKLAQTLFKQWFIDFEFPDENGNPYKSSGGEMVDSELGEIPKGWEVSEIGLIAKLVAGGDKPKNVSDIPTEEFSNPIYSNGITNNGLYGYTDKAKIFEESVTISARGTIGFVCLRTTPYVPIVRLISAIADEKYISTKFLYMWLKNQNIYGNGTTQQQLTVPDFKSSKIIIPVHLLVEEYTNQMNNIIENINFNKKENQELTNIRDTLLPKLISGELEIKNVNILNSLTI